MLDLINQAQREKDGIIALYNPKRAIYGTDGIVFATGANGQTYRAIDTKANISTGSDLTDTTKWLKVDLVSGQSAFNADLGAVKKGLDITRNHDLTLNVTLGSIKTYDSTLLKYTSYNIAESLSTTFDYIDVTGIDVDVGATVFDTDNYDNGGVKTVLNRSNRATFQKVYVDVNGNYKVMRGTKQYQSISRASYEHIDEEIPNLVDTKGLYYIGGLLITKNCDELDNSRKCRAIKASKLGESHVGGGGGNFSLLKAPMATLADIQAIEAPEDGEMRQNLDGFPYLIYYCFNTNSPSGLTADDGTTGFWNKISNESGVAVNPTYNMVHHTSYKNARIDITPTRDIRVFVTWNVTAWIDANPAIKDIYTNKSGATVVSASYGRCRMYVNGNNRNAHISFSEDSGIFDLTAGATYTFSFGGASTGVHVDQNDVSSVTLIELAKNV